MPWIYTWQLKNVMKVMILGIIIWTALDVIIPKKIWKIINIILMLVAVYGVLRYSVFGRTSTDTHIFCFTQEYYGDYVRELVMNVFLYFPLGLTLSVLIGRWRILVGFLLSILIETIQYIMGTGWAEVIDVLCNTLGVLLGGIGVNYISRKIQKVIESKKSKDN